MEPHHTNRVAETVTVTQSHAVEEGPVYASHDYARRGMQYFVIAFGHRADLLAYSAVHPDACHDTKAIIDMTCVAKREGGLYTDLDIWCHSHKN